MGLAAAGQPMRPVATRVLQEAPLFFGDPVEVSVVSNCVSANPVLLGHRGGRRRKPMIEETCRCMGEQPGHVGFTGVNLGGTVAMFVLAGEL